MKWRPDAILNMRRQRQTPPPEQIFRPPSGERRRSLGPRQPGVMARPSGSEGAATTTSNRACLAASRPALIDQFSVKRRTIEVTLSGRFHPDGRSLFNDVSGATVSRRLPFPGIPELSGCHPHRKSSLDPVLMTQSGGGSNSDNVSACTQTGCDCRVEIKNPTLTSRRTLT